VAVAIVVQECAARVPAIQAGGSFTRGLRQAGALGNICEGSIAAVPIQHTITPVGHQEISISVVVVVSYATALAPAGAGQSGFDGHVSERSVAIVLIEPIGGRVGSRPFRFKTRAVDEEDVEPAIVVEVEECHTAAGSLEEEPVPILSAKNGLRTQPGFPGDVHKLNAQPGAPRELIERKHRHRCAQGPHETAPRKWHNVACKRADWLH
jgi:hypothetical protein